MLSSNYNISFFSSCQDYVLNSLDFDEFTGNTIVHLEKHSTSKRDRFCPECHSYMHVYDTANIKLKDMPSNPETTQTLSVNVKRFRCPNCGKTATENIDFKEPGTLITKRVANWIRHFLRLNMSITAVTKITGVHWDTISRLHKEHMDNVLAERAYELKASGYRPRRLAVDEFAIHKGHTYATCVMDLDEGDIIWAGKGRTINGFRHFFEEIDSEYLSEVEAVAMDMNAAYNVLVKENLPQADIVYDRYHFQALFGKSVLGAVRLEEAAKHKAKAEEITAKIKASDSSDETSNLKVEKQEELASYRLLKKSRWNLLMNSSNLSEARKSTLNTLLDIHRNVAICYTLKEEMCRLFTLTNVEEAEAGWHSWFNAAKSSGVPALEKFAKQKEKRLPGLIAHAKHQISTGRLEGYNNRIKVAKRIGFGYRNDEYFFSLIKYLSLPANKSQSPRNP